MKKMNVSIRFKRTGRAEYKDSILADTTGEWIQTPKSRGPLTMRAIPTGTGTARIETTTSPLADVEAGTEVAVPWSAGEVSAPTTEVLTGPVTAVRVVATTAAASLELIA